MINVWDYNDCEEIRIVCKDGQILQGKVVSVDDEFDSGFDEDGISIVQKNGGHVGIPQSDILRIEPLD